MLLMMKNELKKKNKTGLLTNDFDDIMKTIDITLFKLRLEKKETITVDMFERESYDEIIREINLHDDKLPRIELLIEIYKEKGEYLKALNLLREAGDYISLVSFIEENLKKLPEDYIKERIADDLLLTLKQGDENTEECAIKKVLKILDMACINKNDF
ncbi:CBM_collapsed_G0016570.mRNA.1.CDS.1 [Saccharomyces cerevisiae]|nr:CBM_collapsed_G0016570.mRNA.1.CDS.1 [Saccharomyces cerevisiae]